MRFQTMISLPKSRRRSSSSSRSSNSCEGGFVKKKKIRAQPQQQHQYIPEEIVFEVLQKLPAKSLLRFRCVSKLWGDLISKTRTHRHKLFISSTTSYKGTRFQSIDQTTLRKENIVAPKDWQNVKYVKIHSSCDGLILVEYLCDLYLWNPSIRYSEKVLAHDRLNSDCFGGLFFDYLDNEYKIIMAFCDQTGTYAKFVVKVGSPRNKSWTRIRWPYSFRYIGSGPVLNNHLHWFASKRLADDWSPSFIIYFDRNSYKFLKLPMPPDGEREGDFILSLAVLDGCICMSRTDNYGLDKIEVLVMKEYGVKESWAVLFRIDGFPYAYYFHPLFYVDERRSKVLIHISHNEETVIVYDKDANSVTDSKYLDPDSYYENVYEETLTRPTRSDWEELDSRGEAFYVENYRSGHVVTSRRNGQGYWSADEIYDTDDEIYSEEEDEDGDWVVGDDDEIFRGYLSDDDSWE